VDRPLSELPLWKDFENKRLLTSFDIELTARCNFNCRHCYINQPAGDKQAQSRELTKSELFGLIDQARDLGALWCLLTGGEPLLRKDFPEIYTYLKQSGFLVSVFTNAALITDEHIRLFKQYPPRDIEVTVYGAAPETYERITRIPGSFMAFQRGLDKLLANGIKVRLKTMALQSNLHELDRIAEFCRQRTADYYRFDPHLHLRYDHNPERNRDIQSERLFPEDICRIEQADPERLESIVADCRKMVIGEEESARNPYLFKCAIGLHNFTIGYDGFFRLCASLNHPDFTADLRTVSLKEAWNRLASKARSLQSKNPEFLEKCHRCAWINFCLWCPAHAYLETNKLDQPVKSFCRAAKARVKGLGLK
jgi:radical SAM protein with 4Fe4S-binding SPASM domain